MREKDETTVIEEGSDTEVQDDIKVDEFEPYFNKSYEPQVVITSSANPSLVSSIRRR